jgi:uncharacterized protein
LSVYFFDTSALAKRYVTEKGSRWIKRITRKRSGNVLVLSTLATVELVAAIVRREREGTLSNTTRIRIQNHFFKHLHKTYLVVDLGASVLAIAQAMVAKHPLRTLDSLQLACAVEAMQLLGVPIIFVSADQRLLTAAAAEGFVIDDPNAHP